MCRHPESISISRPWQSHSPLASLTIYQLRESVLSELIQAKNKELNNLKNTKFWCLLLLRDRGEYKQIESPGNLVNSLDCGSWSLEGPGSPPDVAINLLHDTVKLKFRLG